MHLLYAQKTSNMCPIIYEAFEIKNDAEIILKIDQMRRLYNVGRIFHELPPESHAETNAVTAAKSGS